MFSADPFSNIPFCGSTIATVYPYVKRDIYRQVLGLNLAKPIIYLNMGKHTDRTVLVLKMTNISLNLNRK